MVQTFPIASNDDLTTKLSLIWQQLLGVDSVAIDQNFFDLGGESSLAVQMFARVEEAFGVKLPLATLYEAPTIAELSAILRSEVPYAGWSPLVPIQISGSRPPFFCMHGAGGNVLTYRELSKHLGSDQPFYGLQCPGLDGKCPPLTKIEDMARLYGREIRKVQPNGPYFLGGYCMGGTIAYEVAQQLTQAGESCCSIGPFRHHELAQDPPQYLDEGISFCAAMVFPSRSISFFEFIRPTKISARKVGRSPQSQFPFGAEQSFHGLGRTSIAIHHRRSFTRNDMED